MNKIKITILLIASIGIVGLLQAQQHKQKNKTTTTTMFEYKILNFNFKSPIELPSNQDIGASKGEVFEIGIPSSNKDLNDFSICFYKVPEGLKMGLNSDKPSILTYCKNTYLGVGKPGDSTVKRNFFGKEVEGDKNKSNIPTPSTKESFIVELKDGNFLFLGIKYTSAISSDQVEKIITSLSDTLKEE